MTTASLRWAGALVTALVLVLPAAVAAEITADLEPALVDELDTARLIIRATGSNQAERLDLSALEEDFEVLTTQSASQYRSINGQVESWVEYQIMLRPRRPGDLVVPPIEVGGGSTPELTLRVRGLDPEVQQAIDRMVFFEIEVTANPVYVQAQTVMVRRLYYSSGAQIYSDLPGMPEIPSAIVLPLGETTSTTVVRDGQRYGVVEQRFAIFPEESGELTIPSISVTSSVRVQSGGRTRRSGVRIATEPMTLEVLPIPSEYPADQPWLPAQDVTISDRWEPPDARVEVGDPVRRTLSARVHGNVASALPPLEPTVPEEHFRRYPEPPALRDDTNSGSVRGSREQAYAMMPTAPGTVSLPPTELTWWDVDAREVRTAQAPGRTFWIAGAAIAREEETTDPVTEPADAQTATELPPPVEVDVRDDQVPWPGPERRRILAWTVLALGVVAGVFSWGSRRRELRREASGEPRSRAVAWRGLKSACRGRNPVAVHDALVAYLRSHYRTSAAEAVRRFRRSGHGALLDELNARLYRQGRGEPPSDSAPPAAKASDVLEAVRSLRSRRRHPDPLPALYE